VGPARSWFECCFGKYSHFYACKHEYEQEENFDCG